MPIKGISFALLSQKDIHNEHYYSSFCSSFEGAKVSLPRSCLPPKVPHFAGRQRECEEIISHITSESTRIVSIWGSPGFGKTSVAVAVGHRLQTQGLPVWFLSLRGLQSKADLTSKLLSHLRQPSASDQSPQRLSLDDELCNLVTAIADSFLLILDNADELLESGVPNVKEEVIHLLEEILRRNERVKIAVTTRESLEFLNMHFQGHHAVRIRPLDTSSSQKLVHELLPNASTFDCQKIAQICGNVPLALQLMCPFISEGDAKPISQSLEDFMETTGTIVEKLDNPNYPSNLKLQLLFESSFQRLSTQEKEFLVSLSILHENFDQNVATAVCFASGKTDQEDVAKTKKMLQTKKMFQSLQRKSLLDSGTKPGSFSMHPLIQSFTREKGEHEMKETFLKSKARFHDFYVSSFDTLNNEFLAGRSMSAFQGFYEDKQSIIQCLIESCSDSRTADNVFEVLSKAEMFLDSLFWLSSEAANFDKIYDSAAKGARNLKSNVRYRRLLVSRAFSEITWGTRGKAMHLLSEAEELQETSSSATDGEKGKRLCYIGLYQLVTGQIQNGVKSLRQTLSLVDNSAEGTVLKIIVCQILAVYHQFKNYSIDPTCFNRQVVQVCRTLEQTHAHLLVIPGMDSIRTRTDTRKMSHADNASTSRDHPLQLQVIFLVNEVTKHFIQVDSNKSLVSSLYKILKDVETELAKDVSLGLFSFHRIVVVMFQYFNKSKDAQIELAKERINYHRAALEQCNNSNERNEDDIATTTDMHKDSLAKSFLDLGSAQRATGDLASALQSEKVALDIRLEHWGEDHLSTADSYHSLGASYYSAGDFASALQSTQRALNIRQKVFGDKHASTAFSYQFVGATQHKLGDFSSALQSKQRALNIRLKLFGQGHSTVADSYYSLYVTQLATGDKTAAVQSKQRALDIKHKLCREDSVTAARYSSVAVQRQELGEYTSDRTEWLDTNDYS